MKCIVRNCQEVLPDKTMYYPLPPDGSRLQERTFTDPDALRKHIVTAHSHVRPGLRRVFP